MRVLLLLSFFFYIISCQVNSTLAPYTSLQKIGDYQDPGNWFKVEWGIIDEGKGERGLNLSQNSKKIKNL